MIKTIDIAWLAGLLEGEAWFGLTKGKYPVLGVGMTDEDVIIKVADMWDVRVGHYRNIWTARVYGAPAIKWMMILLPFLGKRRRENITSIINGWKRYSCLRRALKEIRSMAKCHPDKLLVAFGLCRNCYMRRYREEKLLKKAG